MPFRASLFASLPLRPSARRKKLVSGTRELIRFYGLSTVPTLFKPPLAAVSGFQRSRLPATEIADRLYDLDRAAEVSPLNLANCEKISKFLSPVRMFVG